jgi:uncharacterized membrane protein YkvA (DUF1232 family)
MKWLDAFKDRARALKREVTALGLAVQDPRTPWFARILAVAVIAYAFSPIDLIPDFIPVLGYLDDLILVPAGIALVIRLIPAEVMAEARLRSDTLQIEKPWLRYLAAGLIILLWLAVLAWCVRLVYNLAAA